MRHPTYKHLEARLRLGPFSVGQWAQVLAGGVLAALFGGYLSPLPPGPTIFVSIVGAGLPVAVSYGAMGLEFSVGRFARAAWRYWRDPRRFLPGPGSTTKGYVVQAGQRAAAPTKPAMTQRTEEPLWDF